MKQHTSVNHRSRARLGANVMAQQRTLPHSALLIASAALLLGGCDTAFRVRGEAPLTSSCSLVLLEDDKQVAMRSVSGRFEETFVMGTVCYCSRILQAICNGVVVKRIDGPDKLLSGGADAFNRPHELGLLAP